MKPEHNGTTPIHDPNLYGPGRGGDVYISESENALLMSNAPCAGMPTGRCAFCGVVSEHWASNKKLLFEILQYEEHWKITKRGNLMCPTCQKNPNPHLAIA